MSYASHKDPGRTLSLMDVREFPKVLTTLTVLVKGVTVLIPTARPPLTSLGEDKDRHSRRVAMNVHKKEMDAAWKYSVRQPKDSLTALDYFVHFTCHFHNGESFV